MRTIPKQTISALLLFLICGTTTYSQGWNELYTNNIMEYQGVSFTNATTGTVVGKIYDSHGWEGLLMTTANGGANWILAKYLGKPLFGVHFVDSTHVWAVGSAGAILHSSDAGATWQSQESGTSEDLHSVFFVSPTHGVIAGSGSTVLLTTDAGVTWVREGTGLPTLTFRSVKFVNNMVGVIVGDRVIVKTTDGGFTWSIKRLTQDTLTDVSFADPGNGIAVGRRDSTALVLRTINGGESWYPLSAEVSGTVDAVSFPSPQIAYLAGFEPNGSALLLKSVDGGTSWWPQDNAVTQNTQVFLDAIDFADTNVGFAVGAHSIDGTVDGGGYLLLPGVHQVYPPDNSHFRETNVAVGWERSGLDSCTYRLELTQMNFLDTAGLIDTAFNFTNLFRGVTFNWRVMVRKTINGHLAQSPWSDFWTFSTDPTPVTIQQIQQVNGDSLLLADQRQLSDSADWHLQGSPLYGLHVWTVTRCIVPPLILTKNRYTMVMYDTAGPSLPWRGIMVQCDPYGPLSAFLDCHAGDILYSNHTVTEIPWPNSVSDTRLQCLGVERLGTGSEGVLPLNVQVSDFYAGSYPTGKINFSNGEQYEGMLVELHGLQSTSVIDSSSGTFMMVDSAGNTFSESDFSKWFTLAEHRDSSSHYSVPLHARIDTIRGIIVSASGSPNPNGGYGYTIAPVYPGDIVYGGSSRSQISGTIFADNNQDTIRNAGEPGIAGWRVTLTGKAGSATFSDRSGQFSFSGIDSGTYTVTVQPSPEYSRTFPSSGAYTRSIGTNDTISGLDFGFHFHFNQLFGIVFEDRNRNGVKDDFEAGIPDIRMRLSGDQNDSVTTDSAGYYIFSQLIHGTTKLRPDIMPPWELIWPPFPDGYEVIFNHDTAGVTHVDFALEKIPVRVKVEMSVNDNMPLDRKLIAWGVRPGASYGIWGVDPACTNEDFAEHELPLPPLINGYFDGRFINPSFIPDRFEFGSWYDMRDFSSQTQVDTHVVIFQPGYVVGADYPMSFTWSKDYVKNSFIGPVTLTYPSGPVVDMKEVDSITVSNPAVYFLRIISQGPNIPLRYAQRWWLVSLPMETNLQRLIDIFPSAITKAYAYTASTGYKICDTLSPGSGYWLRMIFAIDSGQVNGNPITLDSISVAAGWNMVGSLGVSIPTADILSDPPGILSSHVFGYDNGYYVTDSVRPYFGYWIKSSGSGKLIMRASPHSRTVPRTGLTAQDIISMNVIRIVDAAGVGQSLYYTSRADAKSLEQIMVELPPLPPEGIFDARYTTNRMIEGVILGEEKEIGVRLTSAHYPVSVEWNAQDLSSSAILTVGRFGQRLEGSGRMLVTSPEQAIKLRISGSSRIPKAYALSQNYPNPFNPSTEIEYELPTASKVTLRIYNVLGQVVQVLSDRVEDAGSKSVTWNASSYPTGIYFCRMTAVATSRGDASFSRVIKMMLLK